MAIAIALAGPLATRPVRADDAAPALAFVAAGKEYHFDTGALRGSLRAKGLSRGLDPILDVSTGKAISKWFGLLSPYRLLTADTRFGPAGWDWASQSRLLGSGAVEVRWTADKVHPFDMTGCYRLAAADTVDVTFTVTPKRDLPKFELFLASYFEGFPRSFALVRGGTAKDDAQKPVFVEALKADGEWQVFPRDDDAKHLYRDGRWKLLPHPVQWVVRQPMAAPLALRRDVGSGLAAIVMARPADCFAVAMPYGEEQHRSLYLSLFGRDLKAGQAAAAHARLVVRHGLTDEKAVQLYNEFAGQSD